MNKDVPAPDSGEPPSAFCPRCLRRSDPAAIGGRVGLCYCSECGRYACRWCWNEAGGACPGCGVAYPMVVARPLTFRRSMAAVLRRFDSRRSLAAAALVMVAIVLGVTVAGGIRPVGGVEGSINAPSSTATPGTASATSPGATASPGQTTVPTATPTSPATQATTVPGGVVTSERTPTPRPLRATPPPTATPRRTPTPTPTPTATPSPTPTSTPTTTPATCKTVPALVGLTVQNAKAAWTAAGFTGQFKAPPGNAKIVQTQDQTPGACLPANTKVVVTSA